MQHHPHELSKTQFDALAVALVNLAVETVALGAHRYLKVRAIVMWVSIIVGEYHCVCVIVGEYHRYTVGSGQVNKGQVSEGLDQVSLELQVVDETTSERRLHFLASTGKREDCYAY